MQPTGLKGIGPSLLWFFLFFFFEVSNNSCQTGTIDRLLSIHRTRASVFRYLARISGPDPAHGSKEPAWVMTSPLKYNGTITFYEFQKAISYPAFLLAYIMTSRKKNGNRSLWKLLLMLKYEHISRTISSKYSYTKGQWSILQYS